MNANEVQNMPQESPWSGPSATLPSQSSAQRRVVALTQDPALVRALDALKDENVTVVQVETREALAEEILRGGGVTALIDASSTERQIEVLVDRLVSQFPDVRIIVTGQSPEQNLLATRISQGIVFRFLHKPASAQRLKLFVDAANRPTESRAADTARDAAAALAADGPRGPGGLPLPAIIGGGVAVVALIAALVLFSGGKEEPKVATAAPAAAPVQAAPVPASPEVEATIRSADQAFAANRFVGKDGKSAAELYQKALQAAPQDARAKSGLTRSIDFGLRMAETAFTESRYSEAEAHIAALQVLSPGNSRLTFLQNQLQRERDRAAADENRRLSAEARQDKLRTTLQQANERLRRGALIEPARDSALELFFTAQDLAPGDADVRALRDRLGTRLLDVAGQKLDAKDATAARSLLDAAGNLGVDTTQLTNLRRRADEMIAASNAPRAAEPAPVQAASSTPPPAAVAQPSASATAPPTAAPAAKNVQRIYAASELTLLKREELVYPQRALESSTSGWVDVEFTIATDGSVKNVIVLNSEPSNLFDGSATAGLRKWRYKPVTENGTKVEARTRMRLRFTPRN